MKIRIERELYERVCRCADAVHDPVCVWIEKSVRLDARGQYPDVSYDENKAVATRSSVVARANLTCRINSKVLHGVLQRACAYCEARMPKHVYVPHLREGVDFLIEKKTEN